MKYPYEQSDKLYKKARVMRDNLTTKQSDQLYEQAGAQFKRECKQEWQREQEWMAAVTASLSKLAALITKER